MAPSTKWITADGDAPVSKVAEQTLRARLAVVQDYLPLGALEYEADVEYIHQLRVAARRAEAAIDMYRELLPEWRVVWIEKQLRRIRKGSNQARDDDVLADRLAAAEGAAAGKFLQHVQAHRKESQRSVVKVYERLARKNNRFARRVEKLLRRVRLRGKRRKSKEPTYREWAESHLRPILTRFFALADQGLEDTEALHQFRIQGKRLRYAMELLSAAFGSELRRTAYPLLEKLQDELGKVNDHAAAIDRILALIDQSTSSSRSEYLQAMLQEERSELKKARRRFAAWWTPERRDEMRDVVERAING